MTCHEGIRYTSKHFPSIFKDARIGFTDNIITKRRYQGNNTIHNHKHAHALSMYGITLNIVRIVLQ